MNKKAHPNEELIQILKDIVVRQAFFSINNNTLMFNDEKKPSLEMELEVIFFDFSIILYTLFNVLLEFNIEVEEVKRVVVEGVMDKILDVFGDQGLLYAKNNLTNRFESYLDIGVNSDGNKLHFVAKEFVKNYYKREIDESRDFEFVMSVAMLIGRNMKDLKEMFIKILNNWNLIVYAN